MFSLDKMSIVSLNKIKTIATSWKRNAEDTLKVFELDICAFDVYNACPIFIGEI